MAAALGCSFIGMGEANSPAKSPGSGMKSASLSYKPMKFAELPGWAEDDHAAAFGTFRKSCDRVLASARDKTAASAVVKPAATPRQGLVSACEAAGRLSGKVTKEAAKAFFEANFTPSAVTHNGPQGMLTGYYEPILEGSRTAQGIFQTPIYKRPPDLVNLVDEQKGAVGASLTHARKTDKGVEPFATRAQIEQGALKGKGLELVYFADAVDVFFMQIQGSGRVKLRDGSIIRVHYDGKNGHPYSSIGRYLIDKGLLAADKVSMGALANWLRADPERGKMVMWQNASYVFFRELGNDARGALGAMNAPLTPGRSLAVDPTHHALGTPIFVTAANMTHVVKSGDFNRLMVAQDVGSAIKGPERGDIFFGSGNAAGKLAGVTKHPGKFIVLLPNETPARARAAKAQQ